MYVIQHNSDVTKIMCNACWRGCKQWCQAFTRTEIYLSILEAILIVILVALLVFISIHLSVCPLPDHLQDCNGSNPNSPTYPVHTTVPPQIKCTWVPSKKTTPYTRHYELGWTPPPEASPPAYTSSRLLSPDATAPSRVPSPDGTVPKDMVQYSDESDGEEAEEELKRHILALVKIRPGRDVTFGCLATAVAARWALAAASCLEAVEEVDSLDSFVLLERYGEPRAGRAHALADVRVHPRYRAAAAEPAPAHDVAALRAHGAFLLPLPRATKLPAALLTIGEEYTILGYGRFRTMDSGPTGRLLRRTRVWRLPGGACAGAGAAWAARHLARGRPAHEPPPRAAPLCAGVLRARGAACHYCAGAPLLRAGRLHAVMADSPQCGASCEPAAYVSVPAINDWLQSIIDEQ